MDKLTNDFDLTKNSIIGLTVYLDGVEELYNKTLKEYEIEKDSIIHMHINLRGC